MITLEELIRVVNEECYKVKPDGTIVWRSGMDAGVNDPLIGKNIKAVTDDAGYHKQYTTWPWRDVMRINLK